MSRVEKKNINKLTLIVNIMLYCVFALLVINFAFFENFILNADTEIALDTIESRFYINNLIIIICPFVDSIIGIAFAAYKDKIYGFTVSDLKEMSQYSGLSFVEVISISIISIALALTCYYFNLFYTALIVNVIIFLYTFIFIFTDVSLIARARWKIQGICRYTYQCNQKRADKSFIEQAISIFSLNNSTLMSYFKKHSNGNDDFSSAIIKGINDCCADIGQESSKYDIKIRKLLSKYKKKFISLSDEETLEMLNDVFKKVIVKTFDDNRQVLAFSLDKQATLLDNYTKFSCCVFNYCKSGDEKRDNDTINSLIYLLDLSYKDISFTETYCLDLNCRLLIANMVVKNGIKATMKCFKMETVNDIHACISCQKLFLGDVLSCDTEYVSRYLYSSQDNIQYLVKTPEDGDNFLVYIAKTFYFILGRELSDCILDLKETADKYQDDNEKNIDFKNIIKYCLPLNEVDLKKLPIQYEDYQMYHFDLSSHLLVESLKDGSIWLYEYLNDIYQDISLKAVFENTNFYIFSSIYLYNKYESGELDDSLKNQIDFRIKDKMMNNLQPLLSNLRFSRSNNDSFCDLLVYLLRIYNTFGKSADFSESLNENKTKNVGPSFDNSYLFRWWIAFACQSGITFADEQILSMKDNLTNEPFDVIRYFGKSNLWEAFKEEFDIFYKDAVSTNQSNIKVTLSYFHYFNFKTDKKQFSKVLECLKQNIANVS